jgi:NDP-sugar pyrophosphorylase family protein
MQALILAGGLGTRLRPLAGNGPKAMARPGGRPFLEHQLALLVESGVRDAVLCLGYLHQEIQDHFGDGAAWGLRLTYSVEPSPLGTAGALKWAEPLVGGPFLVLNGDTYVHVDLGALMACQQARRSEDRRALGTLAVARVEDPRSYGTVRLDGAGRILAFAEKAAAPPGAAWISAGVYAFEREVLAHIPAGRPVSLERETFGRLLAAGCRLQAVPVAGAVVDIGTPEGYQRFEAYLAGVSS